MLHRIWQRLNECRSRDNGMPTVPAGAWPHLVWQLPDATITATGNWVAVRNGRETLRLRRGDFPLLERELRAAVKQTVCQEPVTRRLACSQGTVFFRNQPNRVDIECALDERQLAVIPALVAIELAAWLKIVARLQPFTGCAAGLALRHGDEQAPVLDFGDHKVSLSPTDCGWLADAARSAVATDGFKAALAIGEDQLVIGRCGVIPLGVGLASPGGNSIALSMSRTELAHLSLTLAGCAKETP